MSKLLVLKKKRKEKKKPRNYTTEQNTCWRFLLATADSWCQASCKLSSIRSEVLLLIFLGFCDYETMKNLEAYIFFTVHIGWFMNFLRVILTAKWSFSYLQLEIGRIIYMLPILLKHGHRRNLNLMFLTSSYCKVFPE